MRIVRAFAAFSIVVTASVGGSQTDLGGSPPAPGSDASDVTQGEVVNGVPWVCKLFPSLPQCSAS